MPRPRSSRIRDSKRPQIPRSRIAYTVEPAHRGKRPTQRGKITSCKAMDTLDLAFGIFHLTPWMVCEWDPLIFLSEQARVGLRSVWPDRHGNSHANVELLHDQQVRVQCFRGLCRWRHLQFHHHRLPRQHRPGADAEDVQRRRRLRATDQSKRSRWWLSSARGRHPAATTEPGGAQGGDLP